MTDFAALLQPDQGQPARTIAFVSKSAFPDWLATQPERIRTAAGAARFEAKPGEVLIAPGEGSAEWSVVLGEAEHASVWNLAGAATRLPEGIYRLDDGNPGGMALGWLLAALYILGPRTALNRGLDAGYSLAAWVSSLG